MPRHLVVIAVGSGHALRRRSPVCHILRVSLRVIFIGEFKQALLSRKVVCTAGEAAASIGLFSAIERLHHRTSRDKAGVRFGLSAAGASGWLPAMAPDYSLSVR